MIRLPDIYIIGAQKSGTTTLYDCLIQHPEIYGHPLAKDYPYFTSLQTYREGGKIFASFSAKAADKQFILGGDANALYTPAAPQRILKAIPDVQLVAIVRNPVDRAFSAYRHAVERLLEQRSFEQAIHEELDGMKYIPTKAPVCDYLAHGYYSQQLKRIYDFFPPAQVKIILFEEFKKEPLSVCVNLFTRLNLSGFTPEIKIRNQTKGGSRFQFLASVLYTPSPVIKVIVKTCFPFLIRTGIRKQLERFNRIEQTQATFPVHLRQLLEDHYRSEMIEFENLIGHRIEVWR